MRILHFFLPASLLLLGGCNELGRVLGGASPHEQYAQALADAGLGGTALAAAWQEAAEGALDRAVAVETPFEEVAYFDPAHPQAAGYRLALRHGQALRVQAVRAPADSARLFLDLFRLPEDSTAAPERVGGSEDARTDTVAFSYTAHRDAAFVLRLQPELLHGGRVRLTVEAGGSLGFPVAGMDSEAVRSAFGDARDGGARRHEGLDIFAPRGTPAVAAADGVVSRVGEGGLGGKVVWLAAQGYGLYYAHLDSQLVAEGRRVLQGDTLGLVGNTGNARTTPPHLHFGIYAGIGGAVDPYPFVHTPAAPAAPVTADTSSLGRWARLTSRTPLRTGADAEPADALPAQTALRIEGASGRTYRVASPEGHTGYVEARLLTTAPLCTRRLDEGRLVRTRPTAAAPVSDSLGAGDAVDVQGQAGDFLLVRREDRHGWISEGGLAC